MKVYYELYYDEAGVLFHMTEDINQHQKMLDQLHALGYQPVEKRVKVNG